MQRQNFLLTATSLLTLILTSCGDKKANSTEATVNSTITDTTYHGYNELADSTNRKTFTISDYNTDNREVKNIERPAKSVVATNLDTTSLFSIWTSDPEGPHADFVFSSQSFFVVDYDGDGDMPYILTGNKLKIYYNDFIQEGEIVSVDKDTLKIKWKDYDYLNNYVRWTQ
jgi:hypothetical protein